MSTVTSGNTTAANDTNPSSDLRSRKGRQRGHGIFVRPDEGGIEALTPRLGKLGVVINDERLGTTDC